MSICESRVDIAAGNADDALWLSADGVIHKRVPQHKTIQYVSPKAANFCQRALPFIVACYTFHRLSHSKFEAEPGLALLHRLSINEKPPD
jgi:hypothetical protein